MNRKEQMQQLRDRGLSYQAIAELYNISRQRVHQILSKYQRLNVSLAHNGWYFKLHNFVMERDGNICLKCGVAENLLVHHRNGDDTNNELGNLVTLCQACHLALHKPLAISSAKATELLGRLWAYQKEREISDKDCGALLGITWSMICYLKSGKRRPSKNLSNKIEYLIRGGLQ